MNGPDYPIPFAYDEASLKVLTNFELACAFPDLNDLAAFDMFLATVERISSLVLPGQVRSYEYTPAPGRTVVGIFVHHDVVALQGLDAILG